MQHLKNIYHLGIKEIIELSRDGVMMILIVYSFTMGVYTTAVGTPESVLRAPIAIVDEDHTQLSERISDAFLPPIFRQPDRVTLPEIDAGLDAGKYTFGIVIPSRFQQDLLARKNPEIQVNADATQMTQAFVGTGYIQQIIQTEISKFVEKGGGSSAEPARLDIRNRFNENLTPSWFGGVNQLVNNVTMLAIILIGAALIRERETGTLEHLLVMPVTPFEIMCAKIWSMLVVVLLATLVTVLLILKMALHAPIEGSIPLFLVGVALHLFAVTSMGIFLACIAQNMPQLGMLFILVLMPMSMLSGGQTPLESMPQWVQNVMQLAPTTHFVLFSQEILFRGAGFEVVWKPFLALIIIGLVLFLISLHRFRKSLA